MLIRYFIETSCSSLTIPIKNEGLPVKYFLPRRCNPETVSILELMANYLHAYWQLDIWVFSSGSEAHRKG